jgi:hypothetical protein
MLRRWLRRVVPSATAEVAEVDPDPTDSTYETDYVIVRRHPDGRIEVTHDHHIEGLFPRQRWLDLLAEVGFVDATSQVDEEDRVVFAGKRPL